MTANANKNFARAMKILEDTGLLMLRGTEIPDICELVTSQKIKGSWWGDPAGSEIFAVGEMISDHPDVTVTKLIAGKVTFVHRSLWPKLIAVGHAREEWQMKSLSSPAKLLLRKLDKEGSLVTGKLGKDFGEKTRDAARELELKLLIHSEQFHTESGFHAKLLETWDHWATRMKVRNKQIEPSKARDFFEKRVEEIRKNSGLGRLPWQPKKLSTGK
jgi:hypothetical protein